MDIRIETLFREYENAFSSLDVRRNASFYADNVISAGPEGAVITRKDALIKAADRTADYYRSIGLTSVRITHLEEIPVSQHYSLVKVHWEATLTKKTKMTFTFEVSYIVQKDPDPPKIILFIAHQDQEEVLRLLGLR